MVFVAALELDPDTTEVITMLRGAVASSGLSQAAFARAVGTSPARLSTYLNGQTRPSAYFVVRARRLGRALGRVATQGLMSAPATGAAIRTHRLSGETDWMWRMLLQGRDHLALILDGRDYYPELVPAWEAEPGSTGSREWDALLAALVEHEYEQAGQPAPQWATAVPALAEEWLPEHPFLDPDRVRAETPAWLSRRNIFIPLRDLVTA